MKNHAGHNKLKIISRVLMTSVAIPAIAPAAAQAADLPPAVSITNTAAVSWQIGNETFKENSNTVVTQRTAGGPVVVESFLFTANSRISGLLSASCGNSANGGVIDERDLSPNSKFTTDNAIVLKVERPAFNRDSQKVETMQIIVANGGDHEMLTFIETAADSGEFTAVVAVDGSGDVTDYNCRLSVTPDIENNLQLLDPGQELPFAGLTLLVTRPADRAVEALGITKTASRATAETGDAIQYRVTVRNPDPVQSGSVVITDKMPEQMRFRAGSARVNGKAVPPMVEGQSLTFTLPTLSSGETAEITYLLEVRPGASAGEAVNKVQASARSGAKSNIADAVVRIYRDGISERQVIIGRVVDGDCSVDPAKRKGIANARVMLEDGTYVLTDQEGMYHFEGVKVGTHVVQIDEQTLPLDRKAISCSPDVRSGGSSISRFVSGRGGSLTRVDFYTTKSEPRATSASRPAKAAPVVTSDQQAAGGGVDWTLNQEPGIAWLFPTPEHNPRSPSVRVAIKHYPGQTVALYIGGKKVQPVAFEGARKNEAGTVAVSLWRGIPIDQDQAELTAVITDPETKKITTLKRKVFFSNTAVRAEIVPELSNLIADGVTKPILALRLTDPFGRPVHHGLSGDFSLPQPYQVYSEADADRARQLAGVGAARPTWRVQGDDGIALVQLEPTTTTGNIPLQFNFSDGERSREQRLEAWMNPGDQPWVIVGLAEGTVGFNKLSNQVEALPGGSGLSDDERIAFYAKGRIKGKWLLTLAYDSSKKEEETRFAGQIDPNAYYTVYGDKTEQRYGAASIRKLYLKLERPQFMALFGDYDANIDEPRLAQYQRSLNGARIEYRSDQVGAAIMAADAPINHRHLELQGTGLSGPYSLQARRILANSERVAIQIRDRFNSGRIIETKTLARYQDYDINYFDGTITFYAPVLSRDIDGNPQIIVVDFDMDGVADRKLVGAARVKAATKNGKLQVGATAIHDAGENHQSDLVGLDVRFRPDQATEVRAEIAASRSTIGGEKQNGKAWRVEAERHTSKVDLLAYASKTDSDFGIAQTSPIDLGTFRYGAEGRVRLSPELELSAGGWYEKQLDSGTNRVGAKALATYRSAVGDFRAGVIMARDELASGKEANSTLLQLGASRRFFQNKLELAVLSDIPLASSDSVDFPARTQVNGRFQVNRSIAVIGGYEITKSNDFSAKTARAGIELAPWTGAKLRIGANNQDLGDDGQRNFLSFGGNQSVALTKKLTLEATVDSNQTVGGVDPKDLVNPEFPSPGFSRLARGVIADDFIATTLGATWRDENWNIAGRAEWRKGDKDTRKGFTLGALRQTSNGKAFGAAVNWYQATLAGGATTKTVNAQVGLAYRPVESSFVVLEKFEVRQDSVSGGRAGQLDILGNPLVVNGDAKSLRLINSLAVNWTPGGRTGNIFQNAEISVFNDLRYVSDRYNGQDIKGFSGILGADIRYDLGKNVEIGATGTVRGSMDLKSVNFSGGPHIGLSPAPNTWLQVGYNIAGYRDHDFDDERSTRKGLYATFRIKFDQHSLDWLGIGSR